MSEPRYYIEQGHAGRWAVMDRHGRILDGAPMPVEGTRTLDRDKAQRVAHWLNALYEEYENERTAGP